MQRILCALVAMISLISVNLRPTQAQGNGSKAVEPGRDPQPINDPVTGKPPVAPALPSLSGNGQSITVTPDQTVQDVVVHGGHLTLQGHVTHDVMAFDCEVTIDPEATVGGRVVMVGGHCDKNAPGVKVDNIDHDAGVAMERLFSQSKLGLGSNVIGVTPASPSVTTKGSDWLGGQFALLLLGLLGAGVVSLLMPRATQRAADRLAEAPTRCLWVGALSALGLLFVLLVDGVLLKTHTFLSILWSPVGLMLAFAPLLALGFGWMAGMHYAGDIVARRFGRRESGALFGRIALGVGAFFLANAMLGGMQAGLGALCFGVEFLVALMGLGAMVNSVLESKATLARTHRFTSGR